MTTCAHDADWRAYLDSALPPPTMARLAAHLDGCAACAGRLATVRDQARFAAFCLDRVPPVSPATTERAWRGLQMHLATPPPRPSLRERISIMMSRLVPRPVGLAASATLATLAVALVLLLTPAGSLALQALSVFRVQTFKAITFEVDEATMRQARQQRQAVAEKKPARVDPLKVREEIERELAAAGITLRTTATDTTVRKVADIAAARAAAPAGTTVARITDLPAALRAGTPDIHIAQAAKTEAVVDLTKLRAALAEQAKQRGGERAGLDPANLPGISPNVTSLTATVQTSFSVVQIYGEGERMLAFAQGPSPVLTLSEGVDVLAIRDALIAMPGISKTTRTQLLSIRDDEWSKTLFIPVPTGATVKDVRVGGLVGIGGEPGLLIVEPEGKAGLVLWQKGGTLYAVVGGYGEDVLLKAANSAQ